MLEQLNKIKILVSSELEAMNTLIANHLKNEIPLIQELSEHLIHSGGKRIRPLLVFLSSKACQCTGDQAISLAAAIEYFHTASLLHDDVVDESGLRRGKKTANQIWGNKACILVGDYLFTQSTKWITACRNWEVLDLFSAIFTQMVQGEIKQLESKYCSDLEITDYFSVIRSKTALLFSISAELGAHLNQLPHSICEGLKNYGLHLGNAFQMVDDALDYCSNKETLGKNIGDDLADGKVTLPLFCALERGTPEQKVLIKKSIEEGSLENLDAILNIINETNAIEYTYDLAQKEAATAIACLKVLEESPYKQALIQLADFGVSRQH
jgi:octaprenyl-diphosphate synthase